MLAGLLVGTPALIWFLLQEARRARRTSLTLSQTNQLPKTRVLERTRQIEGFVVFVLHTHR